MGKNEKTPITVNDKEYFIEDLNDQEQVLINHINDLDRKLASARFNVDQLVVGREAFVNLLAQSLEGAEEITDEDYEEVSADTAVN
jgi:hypothetical protein